MKSNKVRYSCFGSQKTKHKKTHSAKVPALPYFWKSKVGEFLFHFNWDLLHFTLTQKPTNPGINYKIQQNDGGRIRIKSWDGMRLRNKSGGWN